MITKVDNRFTLESQLFTNKSQHLQTFKYLYQVQGGAPKRSALGGGPDGQDRLWEKLRVVLMRDPARVRDLLVEYEHAQEEWLGAGRYDPDLAQTVREVYLKILDVL